MRLIRSFPDPLPAGRNYVVDDCERLVNTDYSYRGLVALDDDVIHLDWDTAVGRDTLIEFAKQCRSEPGRVRVAPQRFEAGHRRGFVTPQWNCLVYDHDGQALRYVTETDVEAHLFGFGMVYLPRPVLREFEDTFGAQFDAGKERFGDTSFAGWHYRRFGGAPIEWGCKTVHVHFSMRGLPL
jgi:hypothetical protein